MTDQVMENVYRENLEESIIFCLSKRHNIPTEDAMEIYYNSELADQIYKGLYGIQYLDYHVLTGILEQEINIK